MTRKEWPLVIFTLLTQMAVGVFLVLAAVLFMGGPYLSQAAMDFLSITLLLVIPPLLILGVLSASLHLSHPGTAIFAIANLKQSWLSREMLLGVSFGIVTVLLCLLRILDIGPSILHRVLLGFGVLCGVLLLFGMSRIYMLRTVPSWNIWATPLSFFISAILLGALILSITVSLFLQTHSSAGTDLIAAEDFTRFMGWGSAILLSTQLLISFVKDRYLFWRGGTFRESIQLVKHRYQALGILRAIFGLFAIGLCILFALQSLSNSNFILEPAIVLAFSLTLTSETVGRFLFYASFKSSGL